MASKPLTLAIIDGQLVTVGTEKYVIPLISILESVQPVPDRISAVADKGALYNLRGEYIPIVRLHEVLNLNGTASELHDGLLVVVESDNQKVGLLVDEVLGNQQAVIKSLENNFQRVPGISGATILGDGSVSLILEVSELVRLSTSASEPRRGLTSRLRERVIHNAEILS